jgi:hypothetical protein
MSRKLSEIDVLQIGKLTGEPGFGRRLVESLQESHLFELTDDPLNADAVLEAHGEDDDDSFVGTLEIRDRDGRSLWRSVARRPHAVCGPMAYELLLRDLERARQVIGDRS